MSARDDILRTLEDLGGEATPAELAAAAGVAPRTTTAALRSLRDGGLVEGPQSRPRITASARARARTRMPGATGDSFDAAVEAIFGPSPALSAFARLAADLIVARQLHPGRNFYPSLFAYGERSGTGKTALAEFLARAVGLGPEAIVQMGHKSAGEIVGRRVRAGEDYRFEPAAHLGYPFVCLDELGEADADVRRRAQAICHGEPAVVIEDHRVEIRATVMATWNPRNWVTVLGLPYLRRAVVLYADAPGVLIADLAHRLRDAELAGTGAGTLRLDKLRPVASRLDDDVLKLFDRFREFLTDDGLARHDSRILELATLGRAARQQRPAGELAPVAYFVATDLLIVTETVPGLVCDDWAIRLDEVVAAWGEVAGAAELAALAARREELRTRTGSELVARRRESEREDLELTGARARLRAELDEAEKAIRHVPVDRRPVAVGIRATLRRLRDEAGDARSAARLGELRQLAAPVLGQASTLRDAIASELRRREQSKADQAAQREAAKAEERTRKDAERTRGRAARQEQTKALRQLQTRRTELLNARRRKTTKPGENVTARLGALDILWPDVESERVPILPVPGAATVARLLKRPQPAPEFRERRWSVFVDTAGRRYEPGELVAWGTGPVLSVFDAALAELDETERAVAGGNRAARLPPLADRPALGTGSQDELLAMLPGPSTDRWQP